MESQGLSFHYLNSYAETRQAETLCKHTKAPPRYSDATLLGAMETAGKQMDDDELRLAMKDSGLGTPATRAAMIETLLKREYVAREKKSLVATPKGVALLTMLRSPLLTSAELTGQWEQKLARMVRGEYEREAFMREVRVMVQPDSIDDLGSIHLARDVAKKIEESLQYPGQIKVTVIRETRAVDYAR